MVYQSEPIDEANSEEATNNKPAVPNIAGINKAYSNATANTNLAEDTATVTGNVEVLPAGGQQPFNNIQSYLSTNYVISLTKDFSFQKLNNIIN